MKTIFFSIFLLSSVLFASEADLAFSAAVQAGNCNAASESLKKGADINFVDEEWPLFITAVTSNDAEMVEFFLKNKVNIELKGPDGKTALMHALSLRNNSIATLLVNNGANLQAADPTGKTIMMFAAESNNSKLLKELLDKGFDRKKKSSTDKTALDYAVDARAADCSRLLSKLDTLPMDFIDAVQKGDETLSRKLLRDGADSGTKDKNGKAALVIAIEKGFSNIVRMLLEKGADPNGIYFKNKEASIFVFAVHSGQFDAAVHLLRAGTKANFNHRFSGGKTALMLAILNNHAVLTNLLLEKQFHVDITDEFGNTALMYATEHNMYSTVSKLLEKGADPTVRQVEGKTASDIAKTKGYLHISKILIEAEKKWI